MDLSTAYMALGLLLAAYSVVANDSIQTLGTFISSNQKLHWVWLWFAASTVMIITLGYGWFIHDGDMSWERLTKIPHPETFTIFHVVAPATLLLLTRYGIPVSTTFLVLSVFANKSTLESMIAKSAIGYAVAAVVAFVVWVVLARVLHELSPTKESSRKFWIVGQWCATGFLWSQWLMHDMANIAVYLPRKISLETCISFLAMLTLFLGIIFYIKGGRIQKIVLNKTNTGFIRSATIIDVVYALTLWFFKEYNNVPMSTTFVFVGLLAGREIAVRRFHEGTWQMGIVFPILVKDFIKIIGGLVVSICIALLASWWITYSSSN